MIPENEYHPYYKSYIADLAASGKSIVQVLIENQEEVNSHLSELPKKLTGIDDVGSVSRQGDEHELVRGKQLKPKAENV